MKIIIHGEIALKKMADEDYQIIGYAQILIPKERQKENQLEN